MAILSKGTDFSTGDQVTAAKLDALVDNATFASDAVDDSTTALDGNGKIIVKDGGITTAKLNLTGNVGIGTTSPTATLHIVDQGSTQPAIFVQGASSSEGDIAVIDGEALQIGHWNGSDTFTNRMQITSSGSVQVIGAFSKGSGSFKIDHPIAEKKDTHHLVHSFVESPKADNIYRGKVDLVSGTATVNIDTIAGMTEGTFALLNRDIQCFSSNESGWTAVKASVSENLLTITAQDDSCSDTVSWLVIGERQDQHMYDTDWTDEEGKVIVEPLKES